MNLNCAPVGFQAYLRPAFANRSISSGIPVLIVHIQWEIAHDVAIVAFGFNLEIGFFRNIEINFPGPVCDVHNSQGRGGMNFNAAVGVLYVNLAANVL